MDPLNYHIIKKNDNSVGSYCLIVYWLNAYSDQKVTPKEAEDYFNDRIAKKSIGPDHKNTILPEILDSIKEDLPIIEFFEKMLEFEAKVRIAQDDA